MIDLHSIDQLVFNHVELVSSLRCVTHVTHRPDMKTAYSIQSNELAGDCMLTVLAHCLSLITSV
jgi:hypothetical protein